MLHVLNHDFRFFVNGDITKFCRSITSAMEEEKIKIVVLSILNVLGMSSIGSGPYLGSCQTSAMKIF